MPENSKRVRTTRVRALVVSCHRLDGGKSDIWPGRKVLTLLLTCGHLVRRVASRRFLVGEKVVCPQCSKARLMTPPLPGLWPAGV